VITIRHITREAASGSGAVQLYGPNWWRPRTDGLNEYGGWQSGDYETRIGSEGAFHLTLPNGMGSDGVAHMQRFLISRPGFLYYVGDEWVEIYDGADLLYVGTPTRVPILSRDTLQLEGADPLILLQKEREYYTGYWRHAPRDVWEHYTSTWRVHLAEGFDGGLPSTSRFVTTNTAAAPAAGSVRIAPGVPLEFGYVRAHFDTSIAIGLDSPTPYRVWQVKAQFTRNRFGAEGTPPYGDNAYVRVGLRTTAGEDLIYLQLMERVSLVRCPDDTPGASDPARMDIKLQTDPPGPYEVIVEGRERWVYFLLNQQLVAVVPMPVDSYSVVPFVSVRTGDNTGTQYADLDSIMLRRTQPYLMPGSQKGDYHLPGAPPPGGLWGRYYNDEDIHNAGNYPLLAFNPAHDDEGIYHTRIDKTLAFSGLVWWPQEGAPSAGLWWSVRWTGSIYLDLAAGDATLGYTTLQEGARMWVGKTRRGEEYLDNWLVGLGGTKTGGSLRAHIGYGADGTYKSGWYPIIIEYGQRGSVGAAFRLHDGGGTTIPSSRLSPYGIFDEHLRAESHYEALRTLQDTYGYQASVQPRALESGEFPGLYLPRVRSGRDTDMVLDESTPETFGTAIDALGSAHAVMGDGRGLGGDGSTDLTAEMMAYGSALEAAPHLQTEYEQFADVSYAPLLEQRLASLLLLRTSPWQEVSAAPPGERVLADSFTLPGSLEMFDWRAGDGLRLQLPSIGINDIVPRQLMGVVRPFVALGLQAPRVTFRQAPRSMQEAARRLWRRATQVRRSYQGQLVRTTGSGALDPSDPAAVGSRVALPRNLAKMESALVGVYEKPDTAPWYLYVNGVRTNMPAVTQPGIYNVAAYAQHARSAGGALPYMDIEFRLS
jgi:hypothetical protein